MEWKTWPFTMCRQPLCGAHKLLEKVGGNNVGLVCQSSKGLGLRGSTTLGSGPPGLVVYAILVATHAWHLGRAEAAKR